MWYPALTYKSATQMLHLSIREHPRRGGRKTVTLRGARNLRCDFISQKCQELHTHEVSPTWSPNQDLSKDDTNTHENMEGRKSHRAPTKHKELYKAIKEC